MVPHRLPLLPSVNTANGGSVKLQRQLTLSRYERRKEGKAHAVPGSGGIRLCDGLAPEYCVHHDHRAALETAGERNAKAIASGAVKWTAVDDIHDELARLCRSEGLPFTSPFGGGRGRGHVCTFTCRSSPPHTSWPSSSP